MEKLYLMKCGHTSHAMDEFNNAICAICNCKEVISECSGTNGLEGRYAICTQHTGSSNTPVPSRWELPFFKYKPNEKYDAYYCGCWGWD